MANMTILARLPCACTVCHPCHSCEIIRVIDVGPGAIAPGGKTRRLGTLSLTPLFGLLAIRPNQSEMVLWGGRVRAISFCGPIGQNWTLQGAGEEGEETHTWGMYL